MSDQTTKTCTLNYLIWLYKFVYKNLDGFLIVTSNDVSINVKNSFGLIKRDFSEIDFS